MTVQELARMQAEAQAHADQVLPLSYALQTISFCKKIRTCSVEGLHNVLLLEPDYDAMVCVCVQLTQMFDLNQLATRRLLTPPGSVRRTEEVTTPLCKITFSSEYHIALKPQPLTLYNALILYSSFSTEDLDALL